MAKKSKLQTPDWILKGKSAPTKKKTSEKTFKVRECPKCGSDEVGVLLGFEEGKGKGEWECKSCKWAGRDIVEKELTEEEFMEYLDNKGVEVA